MATGWHEIRESGNSWATLPRFGRAAVVHESAIDKSCGDRSRLRLHARQDVLVHRHREGRRGVPEALTHDLGGHALTQQQGCVGVSEAVEMEGRHPGTGD